MIEKCLVTFTLRLKKYVSDECFPPSTTMISPPAIICSIVKERLLQGLFESPQIGESYPRSCDTKRFFEKASK